MHVLPLSCETRQAVTGVVCFRAVPSVKAAVVPSCTSAGGYRQLRKSEEIREHVNVFQFGTGGFNIFILQGNNGNVFILVFYVKKHLRICLNVPWDFRNFVPVRDQFVHQYSSELINLLHVCYCKFGVTEILTVDALTRSTGPSDSEGRGTNSSGDL